MKRFLSFLFALMLVVSIGITGCDVISPSTLLTGDYPQDTQELVNTLRTAIELPEDAADKPAAQARAREMISEFAARYRREEALNSRASYTTIRTALNALAGHYSSYPNRPVPEKLKARLQKEFRQVEAALKRGA
ncbi:MAG: photosystem II protein Psb27 [Cyanothece sp. SIO1E1]|nr:photosystem II protein Psb27 [Cyanothece sp. SIO1E1]